MSASSMMAAPDDSAPSVVMADTAAEPGPSFDCLTTSLFWLLFRLYFCGDLLPPWSCSRSLVCFRGDLAEVEAED